MIWHSLVYGYQAGRCLVVLITQQPAASCQDAAVRTL
jgi:hypothetical protein